MSSRQTIKLGAFAFCLCVTLFMPLAGVAQLPPSQPDPLAKMRAAAAANTEVCSTSEPSACAVATPKIIASALGASPQADNLRRLTDEIGGRVTGSSEMARAVAWGVAGFGEAGVDSVHTEKYTIPVTWSEGASRITVLEPVPFPVHLVSVAWSPATPAAGIDANIVDIGAGEEADFAHAGPATRGAIVLLHTPLVNTTDELDQEFGRVPDIVKRAVNSGAQAILWMSTRDGLLLYRQTSRFDGTGALGNLPQAIIAREDALRLSRSLAGGHKVRVRLELPNHIGGPVDQYNVVAEIRGREKPDEFVLLGAHLDSWDLGTGALDDGCNAALVIEAARDIHLTGLRPRRSLRFVLFTGHEQGMLGSGAYVRMHRAELDHAIAAIIFDKGAGRVTGFSLGARRDIEPGVRESLEPLASWGVTTHTDDAPFGTDTFDFLLQGVPNLLAKQEQAGYARNYHASSDTYDKVDMISLKLNTAVAGVLAFSVAEHPDPLGRRFQRAEVETLLKRTGLDAQMKTFDIWSSWDNGQRGRQP